MQAQLVASVQHSLSMYLYDNAKFLCERLAAEFPCEVHMLARQLPLRAHLVTRPGVPPRFGSTPFRWHHTLQAAVDKPRA